MIWSSSTVSMARSIVGTSGRNGGHCGVMFGSAAAFRAADIAFVFSLEEILDGMT